MLRKLLTLVLPAALLAAVLSPALAADTLRRYSTDSAHGSATSGVHRASLPESPSQVYATGNCAHCHEQHASVNDSEPTPTGGSGYYDVFKTGLGNTTNFCFGCHGSGGQQTVVNYNYTYRFGAFTTNPVTTIEQAFGLGGSGGSAHDLDVIGSWAYSIGGGDTQHGDWGFVQSGGLNATNPCLACHDVHRAMPTTASADPTKAAIILPVAHNKADSHYRHLWGDDAEERQDVWAVYQAPFQYPAPAGDPAGPYEPDGSATANGSNIPNYIEQCLACHRKTTPTTRIIRWENLGGNVSYHGLKGETFPNPQSATGDLKPPYVRQTFDPSYATDPKRGYNYYVGCLDCHEPHGSRLRYLLREEVNGWAGAAGTGIVVPAAPAVGDWLDFCKACHTVTYPHFGSDTTPCSNCHYHPNVSGSNYL